MAMVCSIWLVASIRTNVCFFVIIMHFVIIFSVQAASFWYYALGNTAYSTTLRFASGGLSFSATMIGWYLFASMIFESTDLPFRLPLGDLSTKIKGHTELMAERERAKAHSA